MNTQAEELIEKMAGDLRSLMAERKLSAADPVMIGIRTGGVWIAQRLHRELGLKKEPGILDINFYRDDFSRIGLYPRVKPSVIKSDLNNQHIILVDDVLHTGRTICAALNEIADYGRPAAITLAVLINRRGREMPVAADIRGADITLGRDEQIKLRGPDRLGIEIIKADDDGAN